MAVIIPENIPSSAPRGAHRILSLLQRLPDDYLVYYEPLINPHRPDCIIISPYLGLLIVTIRHWYPRQIRDVSETEVRIGEENGYPEENPIHRADRYLEEILRKAKRSPLCSEILEAKTNISGFRFPTGNLLVLPNCTDKGIADHPFKTLFENHPAHEVMTRETMIQLEHGGVVDLLILLKSLVHPHGVNIPLSCEQIHSLRAVIHDEIVVGLPTSMEIADSVRTVASLKILDCDQERILHRITSGHHLICGPAGSGKTSLLIARGAVRHMQQEEERILVLCSSQALLTRLTNAWKRYPRIRVSTFPGWVREQGFWEDIPDSSPDSEHELGEACFRRMSGGEGDVHRYDAVFIEEAHLFPAGWLRSARLALRDPDHGDLILVADGEEGCHGPEGINWRELGIHIHGHIHHLGITIGKAFQNTREILCLARLFLLPEAGSDEDFKRLAFLCDCQTRSGLRPLLVWNTSHEHQVEYAVYLVQRLLSSIKSVHYLSGLKPDDIAILYPYAEGTEKNYISAMIPALSRICPVQWVAEESSTYDRAGLPGLKVHDCHSIGDRQYRVVMILFAENFERFFTDSDYFSGRNLFYTSLTRPLDFLTIQYTEKTPIIAKIIASGYADEFLGK